MSAEAGITREQPRQLFGFEVVYDPELQLTHYTKGDFEMFLDEEALNLSGNRELRTIFSEFLGDVDRYTNLDPRTRTSNIVTIRHIGKIGNIDLAVKGSAPQSYMNGRGRHNHRAEFIGQRKNQIDFSTEASQIIRPIKVFGYVRFLVDTKNRYEEYILMESFLNAKQVENFTWKVGKVGGLDLSDDGFDGSVYSDLYKEITRYIKPKKRGRISKSELWGALKLMGFQKLGDVKANNILDLGEGKKPRYILIDQF